MEIIGLSGYARVGKDEAAKVLVEEFGFTRVAFADKLREFVYALNPIVGTTDNSKSVINYVYLQEVIDRESWDRYKEGPYGGEIRRLLQRVGTEAGRQTLWDSIWVDAAFAGLPDDARVCIPDCRFENEARAVVDRGGQMWRVTRTGVGPVNSHPSETSLDNWNFDVVLFNDGALETYQDNVRSTYGSHRI